MTTWRVCLVEDDPSWQQAIGALLGLRDDLTLAGVADSYKDALAMLENAQPDLVLLDFQIQGSQTGLDVGHWLVSSGFPADRIILVSSSSPQTIGSHPFVLIPKPQAATHLLDAIDEALLSPVTQ